MKNKNNWKPTKFIYRDGKLRASRNPKEVGISSRLGADIVAEFYDINLKKYAKGNLLDLGCGKVPFYEAYKDLVEDNICVDWENTAHKNDFIDFYADLNTELPIDSEIHNTIILSDVLEHIINPKLLMNEIGRIMAKDGILLLNVPFFYWIHEEPHDYHRYTKYSLMAMAKDAGFEIIDVQEIGGVPEIITDILAKFYLKTPIIGRVFCSIIQKLTYLFIKTNYGKRVSKNSAGKFPYGYFLIAKKN